MLIPALVLGTLAFMIEMLIVYKSKFLFKILAKNGLIALVFSMGLTWFIGHLFGAVGITALIGGILTTCLSFLVYSSSNAYDKISIVIRKVLGKRNDVLAK